MTHDNSDSAGGVGVGIVEKGEGVVGGAQGVYSINKSLYFMVFDPGMQQHKIIMQTLC